MASLYEIGDRVQIISWVYEYGGRRGTVREIGPDHDANACGILVDDSEPELLWLNDTDIYTAEDDDCTAS